MILRASQSKRFVNEPDKIEELDGDLSKISTQLQENSKLPVFTLKLYLHHYNIPWSRSKVQLVPRVLAL